VLLILAFWRDVVKRSCRRFDVLVGERSPGIFPAICDEFPEVAEGLFLRISSGCELRGHESEEQPMISGRRQDFVGDGSTYCIVRLGDACNRHSSRLAQGFLYQVRKKETIL